MTLPRRKEVASKVAASKEVAETSHFFSDHALTEASTTIRAYPYTLPIPFPLCFYFRLLFPIPILVLGVPMCFIFMCACVMHTYSVDAVCSYLYADILDSESCVFPGVFFLLLVRIPFVICFFVLLGECTRRFLLESGPLSNFILFALAFLGVSTAGACSTLLAAFADAMATCDCTHSARTTDWQA